MNRNDRISRDPGSAACPGFLVLSLLLGFAGSAGAAPWIPVGPGGAGQAPLRSLTAQAGTGGGVWLGMPHGALYRSRNGGTSWSWAGQPFGGRAISAIDADPARTGRLFAATSFGVYRTDDGGTQWNQVSAPGFATLLGNEEPDQLQVASGTIYLSAGSRLLVSVDGGRTFEVRFVAAQSGILFAADPSRPGRVYLSQVLEGLPLLRTSPNAGKSWTDMAAIPAEGGGLVTALASAGGAVYAHWEGVHPGLWRSRNGGAAWQRLLEGPIDAFTVHPTKPRTLYLSRPGAAGPSEFLVSRDGGDAWRVLGFPPVDLERLAIEPGSGTFFGLSRGSTLHRSADGETWETVFAAPSIEAEAARLSFRPGQPRHQTLTVLSSLYRSFDGGATWTWRPLPFRPGDVALSQDPNRMIAISGLNAYLSRDAGRTWSTTSSSLFYGEGLVRADRDTLFAIGCGVVRSADDGESWRVALPCSASDADPLRWTAKLEVDPTRLDRVYAISFQAEIDGLPHGPLNDWPSFLWRSEDGGRTWKKATANLRAFALERGTGRLYGVRGTKLLESEDAGRTWRMVGTAPEDVLDLIADPATPGALYANGRSGLERSPDGGATWQTVKPRGGWILQFHPANPKLIYTATGGGVYRLALP